MCQRVAQRANGTHAVLNLLYHPEFGRFPSLFNAWIVNGQTESRLMNGWVTEINGQTKSRLGRVTEINEITTAPYF